ncbi:MAG: tRNA pseudouridine synthase B [Alphaproteobacteria bacterium MarineAlpha9_Bin4]|nr:tRNA pseudouridine(55) synthase TruB [Pelagibacterales bacterium]PPR26587.1 MAG: tRNA pseudouridine synthase B [Alphaproteobacteria bacterium MarineAlpha9_Bin4]|tara:strand:- start:570 stop:1469 length:900 start_codon:yes stop_codon:yes gene_type:complete
MQKSVNGWLNIYKEKGQASFSVSKFLKKKFKFKKLGHLGTLDPLAEGVLPIAVGEATKSINFIKNNKKSYTFIIKWGEETDTNDGEGNTIHKSKKRPSYNDINYVIKNFFIGKIKQIPPIFSAVKVNGQRAYKLARKNIQIKLKEKEINIFKLEAKQPINNNFCEFDVICSKGTYIRSLARDIARKLGTVGYAYKIIRTADNVFNIENSITLKKILALDIKDMYEKLLPVECVLSHAKSIILEKKYSEMLKNGMILNLKLISKKITSENKLILVKSSSKLVCIANLEKEYIIPRRNFNL